MVGKLNRVVFSDHSFMLNREDPVQVEMFDRNEGSARLRGRDSKLAVEFRDVLAPQKVIRIIDRLDLTNPELLRQSALPRAKASFTPASGLRRVCRDRLDAHVLQCPSNLGDLARIDRFPSFGCPKEVT